MISATNKKPTRDSIRSTVNIGVERSFVTTRLERDSKIIGVVTVSPNNKVRVIGKPHITKRV